LPSKPSERRKEIAALADFPATLILYEAPHRIGDTLQDLVKGFGGERKAVLARELTKAHEEYLRGTLAELAELNPATLIGEIVLVIAGKEKTAHVLSDEEIQAELARKLKTLSPKDAVAELSKENAVPKNRVYDLYLKTFKGR
jgi:16S rRNA (cytidine1402-2'-O)-methyltransferase